MAILNFDPTVVQQYIPECGGNRTSDNPCIVHLRFVPYSKIQKHTRNIVTAYAEEADGVKNPRRLAEIRSKVSRDEQKRQWIANIVKVENFTDGEPETDPDWIYENAPEEFVTEVLRAMEDAARLTEGQRKNSSAPSGTASQAPGGSTA